MSVNNQRITFDVIQLKNGKIKIIVDIIFELILTVGF